MNSFDKAVRNFDEAIGNYDRALDELVRAISMAVQGEIWFALGYGSIGELATARLGGIRSLSAERRNQLINAIAFAAPITQAELADLFDVSLKTVSRVLKPQREERVRIISKMSTSTTDLPLPLLPVPSLGADQ